MDIQNTGYKKLVIRVQSNTSAVSMLESGDNNLYTESPVCQINVGVFSSFYLQRCGRVWCAAELLLATHFGLLPARLVSSEQLQG